MKSLIFLAASVAALSTAACTPPMKPARTALDCPASQGSFKRDSISADRRSCAYSTASGDQIELRLVPVSTSPDITLKPIEDQVRAEVGSTIEPESAETADTARKDADAALKNADAAKADAQRAEAEAREDTKGVSVSGHGDKAQIDLPGIHITADDIHNKASVRVGGIIKVDASDDGEISRVARDVRLRGDMFSPERRGFRAAYVVVKNETTGRFRTIGYEAGGPKQGPLAVAIVRAIKGHHDDIIEASRKLVRINGGI